MAGIAEDHFTISHKNFYDLNSKIMLTAIISLTAVTLLVIILHVYARLVLRRQTLRRRRAFLGRIRSIDLLTSGEPPKTGLDPAVINTLPTFVFRKTKEGIDGGDDDKWTECAVCLSVLEHEEMARVLPNCKHIFHAECIDKWLVSHATCPICRLGAKPRLQPEPREGPTGVINDDTAVVGLDGPIAPPRTVEILDGAQLSGKMMNASTSTLSSFRRMLSRERSVRRVQCCEDDQDDIQTEQDLERQ